MTKDLYRIAVSIVCIAALTTSAKASPPKPRPFKVGDRLTLTINESTDTLTRSNQRNGPYAAQLAQFIRINSQGNLDNAAQNSPEIDRELMSRLQSAVGITPKQPTSYRVAATIVDILPNATLVIEAHNSGIDQKNFWVWRLSGTVDPKKIPADGALLSENIDDLQISKRVFDVCDRITAF